MRGDTRERREGRVESVSRQLRRVARRETERVCAEISLEACVLDEEDVDDDDDDDAKNAQNDHRE